jgi:hypothetical protein
MSSHPYDHIIFGISPVTLFYESLQTVLLGTLEIGVAFLVLAYSCYCSN